MAEFSPMMQHYLEIKEQYKDCLVFYRLGDFYEMFFDDAITASKELEITLTGRECGQAGKSTNVWSSISRSRKLYSKIDY